MFFFLREHIPAVVRLGVVESNNNENQLFAQTIDVAQRFTATNYKPPKLYDDLMLLKLKHSVTISDYVRPACLYTGGRVEQDIHVTGWGATQRNGGKFGHTPVKAEPDKRDCM